MEGLTIGRVGKKYTYSNLGDFQRALDDSDLGLAIMMLGI